MLRVDTLAQGADAPFHANFRAGRRAFFHPAAVNVIGGRHGRRFRLSTEGADGFQYARRNAGGRFGLAGDREIVRNGRDHRIVDRAAGAAGLLAQPLKPAGRGTLVGKRREVVIHRPRAGIVKPLGFYKLLVLLAEKDILYIFLKTAVADRVQCGTVVKGTLSHALQAAWQKHGGKLFAPRKDVRADRGKPLGQVKLL